MDHLVLWEWKCSCTHAGIIHGISATDKEIHYISKSMYQFNGNKLTNDTCFLNMPNIRTQLGLP